MGRCEEYFLFTERHPPAIGKFSVNIDIIMYPLFKAVGVQVKKNTVNPSTKETPQASKPAGTPEKSADGKPAAAGTASGSGEGKARFEFYKELTDKHDSSAAKKTDRPVDRPVDRQVAIISKPASNVKPPDDTGVYILQQGAYTNMEDAEKVKAKLALLGLVANVQAANIPDKGV